MMPRDTNLSDSCASAHWVFPHHLVCKIQTQIVVASGEFIIIILGGNVVEFGNFVIS